MPVQSFKQIILATKSLHQLHRHAYSTSGPIFTTPEIGLPAIPLRLINIDESYYAWRY